MIVQPGIQTLVEVRTDRHVLVEVERDQRMLNSRSFLAGYGAAQVASEKMFKILVVNFGYNPKILVKGQTVANVKPHPIFIQVSGCSHGERLGIVSENIPTGREKLT